MVKKSLRILLTFLITALPRQALAQQVVDYDFACKDVRTVKIISQSPKLDQNVLNLLIMDGVCIRYQQEVTDLIIDIMTEPFNVPTGKAVVVKVNNRFPYVEIISEDGGFDI